MKNLRNIALLLLVFSTGAFAQQLGSNTQFMFNQLVINPAYAGIHQSIQMDLNAREQWQGLDGAPSTQQLSIHGAHLKKPISFGGTLVRDQIGVTSQYRLNLSTAYRIHTSYDGQLSFGIQAGVFSHQTDFSDGDLTDPSLSGASDSFFSPVLGVGVLWHSPKYYLGISVPQLLQVNFDESVTSITENVRHYYATAGFVHEVNQHLHIKPNALVKLTETGQYQVDLNLSFLLDQQLWLGATYSHENHISGIISYRFTDRFQAGYSYDHPIGNNVLNGSHEVQLSYRMKRQKYERLNPVFF